MVFPLTLYWVSTVLCVILHVHQLEFKTWTIKLNCKWSSIHQSFLLPNCLQSLFTKLFYCQSFYYTVYTIASYTVGKKTLTFCSLICKSVDKFSQPFPTVLWNGNITLQWLLCVWACYECMYLFTLQKLTLCSVAIVCFCVCT